MRSRALSIGLLLAIAALPAAPASASAPKPVIPSLSVSAKTQTVTFRGTRLLVVRSVRINGIERSAKLAVRCRDCRRLRRTKIFRRTTATSRRYQGMYWVLPRGRGLTIDAIVQGKLGRWTVLGPGRRARTRNRLVFKASGCLRDVKRGKATRLRRIKCPAGTPIAPNDTPVPAAPVAVPTPAAPTPTPGPAPAPPAAPPPPPSQVCCTHIFRGASSDVIASPDGRYQLRMQPDGNLVLYYVLSSPYNALWNSATSGTGADVAIMQSDGNLVVYRAGTPLWQSNTDGYHGATLVMQNDGNAVIYHNGVARWSTQTNGQT